jgi:hypothetical protein
MRTFARLGAGGVVVDVLRGRGGDVVVGAGFVGGDSAGRAPESLSPSLHDVNVAAASTPIPNRTPSRRTGREDTARAPFTLVGR